MQNVGLAMEPRLRVLHAQPKSLQQARRRSLQHYNTYPFWTPLLVGIFLSLERDISRGILPPAMLQRVKTTATYTLSALGDSVFSGGALVFFSLVLAHFVLNGWTLITWLWLGGLFLGLQAFKLFTFVGGIREGIAFMNRLKKWDLINWGQQIKLRACGHALAAVLAGSGAGDGVGRLERLRADRRLLLSVPGGCKGLADSGLRGGWAGWSFWPY